MIIGKQMTTEIACLKCGEFFKPSFNEVAHFLSSRADIKYLKRIPFKEQYKKEFKTKERFIISLLFCYCPYCREVMFGKLTRVENNTGGLTEEKYLSILTNEFRRLSGMQIKIIPDDFIYLEERHED
jgi:hypothetical protein